MENWTDLFSYKKRERRGIFVLFLLVSISVLASFYSSKWSKEQKPSASENLKQEYEKLLLTEKIEIEQKKEIRHNNQSKEKKSYQKVAQKPKKRTSSTRVQKASEKNLQTPVVAPKKIVYQKKKPVKIDINKASASEYAQLKGIGEVLSSRIVKYREKLGGFVSVEQVATTYGIDNQVFEQIKPYLVFDTSFQVKMLNFNTDDKIKLANHPYVSEKLASQIVNFRTKVKPYESFNDIEKLYYFKSQPELLEKLKPYISF